MFYLYFILITLGCFILQSSPYLENIRILGLKPNFILPLVIYCGYHFGKMRGFFIGLILGGIMETLGSDHLGIMTLSYALLGGLAGLVTKQVMSESWLSFMVGTFIASILEGILLNLVSFRPYFWSNVWFVTLPDSIYNLFAATLLYWILFRIPKKSSTVQFDTYQTLEE
ncbi:MAG: rod shape-determining protein MreD [bacterium]